LLKINSLNKAICLKHFFFLTFGFVVPAMWTGKLNNLLEILKKMCYDNNEWGYFYQRKAIDFIYFLLWDRTVLFHELILIGNRRNHSCE